jgi:hypothetical protein
MLRHGICCKYVDDIVAGCILPLVKPLQEYSESKILPPTNDSYDGLYLLLDSYVARDDDTRGLFVVREGENCSPGPARSGGLLQTYVTVSIFLTRIHDTITMRARPHHST